MSIYSNMVECNLNLHYSNGKTRKNGNRLEPDGETSFTRICKGMDLQSQMINDKRYGLICVFCHYKMHPPKKKK